MDKHPIDRLFDLATIRKNIEDALTATVDDKAQPSAEEIADQLRGFLNSVSEPHGPRIRVSNPCFSQDGNWNCTITVPVGSVPDDVYDALQQRVDAMG